MNAQIQIDHHLALWIRVRWQVYLDARIPVVRVVNFGTEIDWVLAAFVLAPPP